MSDPLLNNTEQARELFKQFSHISHGFNTLDVVNASLNMVINAIRQAAPTQRSASDMWDELIARSKNTLMDHYTASGKRRNVFPHTQVLTADRAMFGMKKPK